MGPEKVLAVAFSVMAAVLMTAIIIAATKLNFFYGPAVSFCMNSSQNLLLAIAVKHC